MSGDVEASCAQELEGNAEWGWRDEERKTMLVDCIMSKTQATVFLVRATVCCSLVGLEKKVQRN